MLRSPLIFLFGAALFMTACTTPSSHTEATSGDMVASHGDDASAPAAAAAEDDPLVCKKVTQTGTRVAQRICMRQSKIEANQRDAQEMLGEVQKRGAISKQSQQ